MAIDPIERYKSMFHTSNRRRHFNNAGMSPIPKSAKETIQHWAKVFYDDGVFGVMESTSEIERIRESLATFSGAKTSETSFFQTTAVAISQIAFGLRLKSGDEIVVWDQEYPSNLYPWHVVAERTGAKLVLAESASDLSTPVDRLFAKVTERTKVLAFSWVQYRTGAITDLEAVTSFARENGIFTCGDIIQGAGVLPFDFQSSGLDAACGGSHKWLHSPHTVGYLLLREEHLKKIEPLAVGAMTYGGHENPYSPTAPAKEDAQRFEPGGKPLLEILALGASLDLIRETGIDRIAQEAEHLARSLAHGLRERGYIVHSPHGRHHRGAIVNFNIGPDSPLKTMEQIETRLDQEGISYGRRRPPGVRISPHAFNRKEEIDFVLDALSRP